MTTCLKKRLETLKFVVVEGVLVPKIGSLGLRVGIFTSLEFVGDNLTIGDKCENLQISKIYQIKWQYWNIPRLP
jgi:hypothetical protein